MSKVPGVSSDFQIFSFPADSCRYIRYMGHENSYNSWNSLLEFEAWGIGLEPQSIMQTSPLCNSFSLYQNYPNPFNPSTNISFDLNNTTEVKLPNLNLRGEVVDVINNDRLTPGTLHFSVEWRKL